MLLFLKWIEITICFTVVFLGVALGSKYKKEKYRHKPKRSGVHFFVSLVTRALYWGAWMAPWMVDWGFTLRGLFVFAVGCGVRDFKALTAPSSPTCSLSCYTLLCSLYTQIQNVLNTLYYSTTYRKKMVLQCSAAATAAEVLLSILLQVSIYCLLSIYRTLQCYSV